MKNNLNVFAIGTLLIGSQLFTNCAATIRTPPPPARVEVIPVAPSPRHVWVPGHYVRRGRNYVWVNGFYAINGGRRGGRY